MTTILKLIKRETRSHFNYLLKFIQNNELAKEFTICNIIVVMHHYKPLVSLTQMHLIFMIDEETGKNMVSLVMGTNYVDAILTPVEFVSINQVRTHIEEQIDTQLKKIMHLSGDNNETPRLFDIYMTSSDNYKGPKNIPEELQAINFDFDEKFDNHFFYLDKIMHLKDPEFIPSTKITGLTILNRFLIFQYSNWKTFPKTSCDTIFLQLSLRRVPKCGHKREAVDPFILPKRNKPKIHRDPTASDIIHNAHPLRRKFEEELEKN